MDPDKLAALRDRYATARGSKIHRPDFAKVAATQFKDADSRKWPFMDPATFLGAPFRPDAPRPNFADLDVALVGVPMDLGVTNRAGSRLGPRAVRGVERIGPYEHVLGIAPFGEARIADIGDVPMRSRFSLAELPCRHRGAFRPHRGGRRAHARGRRATIRSRCRSSRRSAASARSA